MWRRAIQGLIGAGLAVAVVTLSPSCSFTQKLDDLKVNAGRDACVAATCESLEFNCGLALDGCEGTLDCGVCPTNKYCSANVCSDFPCVARTCKDLTAECGTVSDGCGKLLQCGDCTAPETCGGLGQANKCGCKTKTCPEIGAKCGLAPDGCGGEIYCGACGSGKTCGGDAGANICQ